MAVPGAASGEATMNGGNPQRPVRNRRATEKGKTTAADSDSDSLEAPSTPKKAKARGRPAKNSEYSPDLLHKLIEMMEDLKEEMRQQKEEMKQQKDESTRQIEELRAEIAAMRQEQVVNVRIPTETSPTYANVARIPPTSHPSNLPSNSTIVTASSNITDSLYCTIDTSRVDEKETEKINPGSVREVIEKKMRGTAETSTWRCAAVTKDMKNPARIRVACRNESELQKVKEAAERVLITGARVLRDQLYQIKVDNANRTEVLEKDGSIRADAVEKLGKENNVKIAKIAWISDKDNGKAYGSMIVYVTRSSEVVRLLQGQYFDLAGESAFTRPCKPRIGPVQCYNCQNMGHKAFACRNPQVCGKCAKEGHHHSSCQEAIPQCVPCGGPHESYSKNCRVTHPLHHD